MQTFRNSQGKLSSRYLLRCYTAINLELRLIYAHASIMRPCPWGAVRAQVPALGSVYPREWPREWINQVKTTVRRDALPQHPRDVCLFHTLCASSFLWKNSLTSFYVLCSLVFLTCFRHILFCILFCYCECQLLLKNSLFFSSLTLFLSFLSPPLCSHPIPLFRTHFLCQKSPQFKIRDYTQKTKPNPPISFSLKSPSAYLRGGNGSGRGGQSGGRGVFARTW